RAVHLWTTSQLCNANTKFDFTAVRRRNFFLFINNLLSKLWRESLMLLAVIGLAMGWHLSIVLLERFIFRPPEKPSLAKLLTSAEAELLHALKAELLRKRKETRAVEVERRLEEIESKID
ncbi:MAG: hypothetical protein ACK4GQ_05365, partial [Candidatus Hadarchaeales archaeon]